MMSTVMYHESHYFGVLDNPLQMGKRFVFNWLGQKISPINNFHNDKQKPKITLCSSF